MRFLKLHRSFTRIFKHLNFNLVAMGKISLALLFLFLAVAFFTKPDDKTCTIRGVQAVWGQAAPDPETAPEFFEQFMDLNSQNVEVKDWLFFKQVKYRGTADEKTVAYGAFQNVYATVKPVPYEPYIPKMPPQQK